MYHKPVMLAECIDGLRLHDGAIIVDATLGFGGHSEAILASRYDISLYAFDQDPDAIEYSKTRLEKYGDKLTIIEDNFLNLRTRLAYLEVNRIDGILFDLGISSYQIDEASRGFSFSQESPLDMRMDKSRDLTAEIVVNEYSIDDITRIIRDYGEEKSARKIAKLIGEARLKHRLKTSSDLNNLITSNFHINPKFITKMLSRVYQALRIEVNNEMDVLGSVLKDALNIINPGGRMVIESYHSLEDKIIKDFMRYEALDCICPANFPICNCGKKSTLKLINKKPIIAKPEEVKENNRARSAKLRIAEKI